MIGYIFLIPEVILVALGFVICESTRGSAGEANEVKAMLPTLQALLWCI